MTLRVLIIGAGGHGQVVADILLRMADAGEDVIPIGFLDDNRELLHQTFLGLPVLGSDEDRSVIAHDAVIVAIGDNRTRQRLFDRLRKEDERFVIAKHPKAIAAPDVQMGEGSMICAGVVINTGTVIGSNVILNTSCSVDHHNHIGNHVHIAPGVHLGGEVIVEEGSLIGIGSTVMPRKRVGVWSVVGAGALVHENVQDGATVIGVPAKLVCR